MKTVLIFTFTLCIHFICQSQTTAIPDPNFEQALIDLGHDSGQIDGSVTTANINAITELGIWSSNITDLTGIEDFTALEVLNCINNAIPSLDVSNLTALRELKCSRNNLTNLDVTNNTALTILELNENDVSSIDVSNNTLLEEFKCGYNNLTSLDVTNNTLLKVFNFSETDIATIDVSNNLLLEDFRVSKTDITSLDVTNNPNLIILECTELSSLGTVDLSNNTLLEQFNGERSQLTSINVDNCIALKSLRVFYNDIQSINVSNNINLEYLDCRHNAIVELDLSANTQLTTILCHSNALTSLNIQNGSNVNMTSFTAINNPNLICVEVDDAANFTANWTSIDSQTSFSEDCAQFLSLPSFESSDISLYPNPASKFIQLSNITEAENYTIYSILGKEIEHGKISINEKIDIKNYADGLYVLTFENGSTFKFIKQ